MLKSPKIENDEITFYKSLEGQIVEVKKKLEKIVIENVSKSDFDTLLKDEEMMKRFREDPYDLRFLPDKNTPDKGKVAMYYKKLPYLEPNEISSPDVYDYVLTRIKEAKGYFIKKKLEFVKKGLKK